MNIKDYWKSVRALAAELDPVAAALDAKEQDPSLRTNLDHSTKVIWLYSVRNETAGTYGGRVVSANPVIAARLLKESTHVIATPAQVSEHEAELAVRKIRIADEELQKRGPVPQTQILISPELIAAAAETQRSHKKASD